MAKTYFKKNGTWEELNVITSGKSNKLIYDDNWIDEFNVCEQYYESFSTSINFGIANINNRTFFGTDVILRTPSSSFYRYVSFETITKNYIGDSIFNHYNIFDIPINSINTYAGSVISMGNTGEFDLSRYLTRGQLGTNSVTHRQFITKYNSCTLAVPSGISAEDVIVFVSDCDGKILDVDNYLNIAEKINEHIYPLNRGITVLGVNIIKSDTSTTAFQLIFN